MFAMKLSCNLQAVVVQNVINYSNPLHSCTECFNLLAKFYLRLHLKKRRNKQW